MSIRERHFDYQITIPEVPIGGLTDLSIPMQSDAPFMLRVVKSRNLGPSGWRFQTASRQWQSSDYRTDMVAPQTPGAPWLPSRGVLIEPQEYYPVSSQLVLAVANTTNAPLTNVRILFRGSKLYDSRALASPTYPPKMSALPYHYQLIVPALQTTDTRRDVVFNVKTDSDFAFNYGVCDPFSFSDPFQVAPAGTIEEVYVQLMDEPRRPYSNEAIHINDLFGQGNPTSYPAFSSPTTNSVNDPAVLQFPNRWMPSIYIPRYGARYMDIFRREVTGGMNTVDLYFRFSGVKVFAR